METKLGELIYSDVYDAMCIVEEDRGEVYICLVNEGQYQGIRIKIYKDELTDKNYEEN